MYKILTEQTRTKEFLKRLKPGRWEWACRGFPIKVLYSKLIETLSGCIVTYISTDITLPKKGFDVYHLSQAYYKLIKQI